jgi:alanyl-tRNA synthetase
MTERLYYSDSYLTRFNARPVEITDGGRIAYLDRTAFYPASGGQPADAGTLNGIPVVEVIDEDERVAHRLAAPLEAAEVAGEVSWPRRFDHMQQHSGQHLLSAVLETLYGFATLSFHLGEEASTIDIQAPNLTHEQLVAAERRVNELVWENRPVAAAQEDAAAAEGLRKPTDREGAIRVVTIAGLDRSACGGTHVRATGEIGPVLLRKLDRIRGNVRIEFLCGGRALDRARLDYDALSRAARVFSAPLDEAPALVAAQAEQLKESERARRKLAVERAAQQGRDMWSSTEPGPDGLKRVLARIAKGAPDDEMRTLAQGFVQQGMALYAAAIADPPALLLAASADAGLHAGNRLKEILAICGGRGGGNAALAQGSLPSPEALAQAVSLLGFE